MELACPYLEGGTDSCHLTRRHLASLEETLIDYPSFLDQRRGLWSYMWLYLFTEKDTYIALSLDAHCSCGFV